MDLHTESGGGLDRQRQMPGRITVEKLKSVPEIQDVLELIGDQNLLNEMGAFDHASDKEDQWLAKADSEIINGGGAVLKIEEDGVPIGLAAADKDGVIIRFTSLAGKEAEGLELAREKLVKDLGFKEVRVRLTGRSEYIHDILHENGYRDTGEEKNGKREMSKH